MTRSYKHHHITTIAQGHSQQNYHRDDIYISQFLNLGNTTGVQPLDEFFVDSSINQQFSQEVQGTNGVENIETFVTEGNNSTKDNPTETKNISKNFRKQIVKFVKKNPYLIQQILSKIDSTFTYQELIEKEQLVKLQNNTDRIENLRSLWLPSNSIGREMRVISCLFLRKYSSKWIFNSRVTNFRAHLKYGKILLKEMMKPEQFVFLKREC